MSTPRFKSLVLVLLLATTPVAGKTLPSVKGPFNAAAAKKPRALTPIFNGAAKIPLPPKPPGKPPRAVLKPKMPVPPWQPGKVPPPPRPR